MEDISISVIIPCYNVSSYFESSISSVIKNISPLQKNKVEIIIVNDGSSDNTPSLINDFILNNENDYNIKYLSQENKGLSEARNVGFENSTGEYIFFFDSDDVLLDSISEVFNLIINSEGLVDIYEFNYYRFSGDDDSVIPELSLKHGLKKTQEYIDNVFEIGKWMVWARIFKRSIIERNKFIKRITFEDIIFTSKAYLNSEVIYSVDQVCVGYRYNPSSISYKPKVIDIQSTFIILNEAFGMYTAATRYKKEVYRLYVQVFIMYVGFSTEFKYGFKVSELNRAMKIRGGVINNDELGALGFATRIKVKYLRSYYLYRWLRFLINKVKNNER